MFAIPLLNIALDAVLVLFGVGLVATRRGVTRVLGGVVALFAAFAFAGHITLLLRP